MAAKKVSIQVSSPEECRELFLLKHKDIDRNEVNERLSEFKSFNYSNHPSCELEKNEAMMLFESRGEAKTALELREIVFATADKDKNKRLSFLEWLCVIYNKDYNEVNSFPDDEARAIFRAEAQAAGEAAAKVEAEMNAAKLKKEEEDKRRADELEAESKLTGVAGMSAFFKRQMENVQDTSLTNEQKIKQEAARRKALREAKQKEKEAQVLMNSAEKSASEVMEEVLLARRRASVEMAASMASKLAEEKAARAARKAALNAKWESPNSK